MIPIFVCPICRTDYGLQGNMPAVLACIERHRWEWPPKDDPPVGSDGPNAPLEVVI